MLSSYISVLEHNFRAGPGRPKTVKLGRHTLFVGDNGAGKSRNVHAIEAALTATCNDLLGRDEVTLPADMLSLMPPRERELYARATFTDGPLDGKTTAYTVALTEKGTASRDHRPPSEIVSSGEWTLPVRHVVTNLRKKPEEVRRFLLPFVVAQITANDISSRLAKQFLAPEAPNEGRTPTTIAELTASIPEAEKIAKECKHTADVNEALVTQLTGRLDAQPTDEDMAHAQQALAHIQGVVEQAARYEGTATYRAEASTIGSQIEQVAQQLANGRSQLDTFAPKPAPLPDHTAQLSRLVGVGKGANRAAKEAVSLGLGNCLACGASVTPGSLDKWHEGLVGLEAGTAQQVGEFNRAVGLRQQAEGLISGWERDLLALQQRQTQINNALAGELGTPAPLSLADARRIQDEANRLIVTLTNLRTNWETVNVARTTAVDQRSRSEWWTKYADALRTVGDELLNRGLDAFKARIQRYLPGDRRIQLTLRDGKRDVFRLGLERADGTELALSGGEEAMIWVAITAAILDVMPNPPPAPILIVPDEKGWGATTLGKVTKALATVPYQIILVSTVMPKHASKAWVIHDLDALVKAATAGTGTGATEEQTDAPDPAENSGPPTLPGASAEA